MCRLKDTGTTACFVLPQVYGACTTAMWKSTYMIQFRFRHDATALLVELAERETLTFVEAGSLCARLPASRQRCIRTAARERIADRSPYRLLLLLHLLRFVGCCFPYLFLLAPNSDI